MIEKLVALKCDRPFVCPACKLKFVSGDDISIMLPSKRRFCVPCGEMALEAQLYRGSTAATHQQANDLLLEVKAMRRELAELTKMINVIGAHLAKK